MSNNNEDQRSIPAWAGEPFPCIMNYFFCKVYPRVGGGTSRIMPRQPPLMGLSPRGRGNLTGIHAQVLHLGSIPAWAGEPPSSGTLHGPTTVYPRVGGGTYVQREEAAYPGGLSPRGRGNLGLFCQTLALPRSIPAWAGEPSYMVSTACLTRVYPRVGGGTGDHRRTVTH